MTILWQQTCQLAIVVLAVYILVRVISSYTAMPKARFYLLLAFAVFFYAFGYLLELDAKSLEAGFMAQRVQYCGVATYAPLFYLFVREYNDRPVTSKLTLAALFVFPAVVLLAVNIYPDTTLHFAELVFATQPSPHLVIQRGPLMHLHVAYSYALIVLCMAEVILYYPKRTVQERQKRYVLLAAAGVPSLAIVVFAIERLPVPMQFGSASLVVSLMLLGYYIVHHRAVDWLPFARQMIMENMSDGYVLMDTEDRFLDANAAAVRFFPSMGVAYPGVPMQQMSEFPLALTRPDSEESEWEIEGENGDMVLRVSCSPIVVNGKVLCNSVMLYDVTELKLLVDKMTEIAMHDGLTGLLTRDSMLMLAKRDFDLHLRQKSPCALLMMDIDHFKVINDTYGHPCGDYVLQQIGSIILGRLRRTDVCCRYGGEEFCIMLPTTPISGARSIAKSIRREIEQYPFCYEGQEIQVTISIGLAEFDASRHRKLDELLTDADKALYDAKNNGRNCIVAKEKHKEPKLIQLDKARG